MFIDGWAYDEKCLARQASGDNQGYVLDADHVIHATGPSDMLEKLQNGEVRTSDWCSGICDDIVQKIIFVQYVSLVRYAIHILNNSLVL